MLTSQEPCLACRGHCQSVTVCQHTVAEIKNVNWKSCCFLACSDAECEKDFAWFATLCQNAI